MLRAALLACTLTLLGSAAHAAVVVPFLEDFPTDEEKWRANNAANLLDFVATGGPENDSYVTTEFNYFGFEGIMGSGPVLFRANSGPNGGNPTQGAASDGAFIGDWNAAGVAAVRAWVRHDTGQNLTYFVRVATSFNFPGAVIDDDVTVPSGQWTQITVPIDPEDPACQPEGGEGFTCEDAFASVGVLQIGTEAPEALTTLDQAFTMDLDQVELVEEVPEPGQLALAAVGALVMATARRRRAAR